MWRDRRTNWLGGGEDCLAAVMGPEWPEATQDRDSFVRSATGVGLEEAVHSCPPPLASHVSDVFAPPSLCFAPSDRCRGSLRGSLAWQARPLTMTGATL